MFQQKKKCKEKIENFADAIDGLPECVFQYMHQTYKKDNGKFQWHIIL